MHKNLKAIKKFDIPAYYRSSITGKIKEVRKELDPRKKDFSPAILDFGPVQFLLARHFGFCYGVENAIELSYKALEENPEKRVFLLSQMIHNPIVNQDLLSRGIQFIMDTDGSQFIPWSELKPEDIVIIPAFGTSLEIEKILDDIGIEIKTYNTTCPFVERVWKRSEKLGKEDYTIIIHGKAGHEETRATFSHSMASAPSVIVKNMEESKVLGEIISGKKSLEDFYTFFEGKYSPGFNPSHHLEKVGVINQTTMLASETQAIADFFKDIIRTKYGEENVKNHFADTRDTLCYATNDNQEATLGLLREEADVAIVVGGYNSSNTSHIVELCEKKFPTYFINSDREILSNIEIQHYNYQKHTLNIKKNFLPNKNPVRIILTSGASCPDTLVDKVMLKLLTYFPDAKALEDTLNDYFSPL